MPRLRREAFVALPHIRVRDECGDLQFNELLQVRFAMIARIGGEIRVVREQRLERGHDGDQHFLFGARAMRWCFDDDLMVRIDRRDALYHRLCTGGLANGLYPTSEGQDTKLLHKEYPTVARY